MTSSDGNRSSSNPSQPRREGVAKRARALYESAHGNPVSDDARGVRWALTPRVGVTACVAILVCGAAILWALRAPGGETEADSGPFASHSPSPTAGSSALADPWGEDDPTGVVVVDVAGHVVSPGIQEMPQGSRVSDAIEAAGGFLADAALDTPNLARILVDGEQVFVPGVEDNASSKGAEQTGKINVNRADAAALEELPGVGPVLAQRIVDFREEHGPFGSVDALDDVSGVGPALLAQLTEAATV